MARYKVDEKVALGILRLAKLFSISIGIIHHRAPEGVGIGRIIIRRR